MGIEEAEICIASIVFLQNQDGRRLLHLNSNVLHFPYSFFIMIFYLLLIRVLICRKKK